MAIRFFNDNIKFTLQQKKVLKNWIIFVIENYKFSLGEINYIFTHNKGILEINKKFLNHNYFTDIITFPLNEGNVISGEIYISIETVKENAVKFKTTFVNELNRVIIHGILHLVGLNDKTEKEKIEMRNAEDFALRILDSKLP